MNKEHAGLSSDVPLCYPGRIPFKLIFNGNKKKSGFSPYGVQGRGGMENENGEGRLVTTRNKKMT
jgi:hypothetical protein